MCQAARRSLTRINQVHHHPSCRRFAVAICQSTRYLLVELQRGPHCSVRHGGDDANSSGGSCYLCLDRLQD
jgi:hypothetical protein